jgi:hypothetical protein
LALVSWLGQWSPQAGPFSVRLGKTAAQLAQISAELAQPAQADKLRILHEEIVKRIGAYFSTVRRWVNDTLALKRQRQEQREIQQSHQCQEYCKKMAFRFGLPTFPRTHTIGNNGPVVHWLPEMKKQQGMGRVRFVGKTETKTLQCKVPSFQTEAFRLNAKLTPPSGRQLKVLWDDELGPQAQLFGLSLTSDCVFCVLTMLLCGIDRRCLVMTALQVLARSRPIWRGILTRLPWKSNWIEWIWSED